MNKDEICIIIPSRIGSTRLKNKPLLDINGKTLIQRVVINALNITENVYVATDSGLIKDNLKQITNNVVMTSPEHISGTDRVCEAANKLNLDDNTFTRAVTNLPDNSILVLEDIDALFIERDTKCGVSFSTVLNVLDGMTKKHKLLTFLTTNYKDRLDSALKRSGRIDYELEFTYASKKQTKAMYSYFFKEHLLDEFLKFTKKMKYTTSDLHKFLFKYRKCENIMEHTDEFVELLNKNVDSAPEHFYI